MRKLLLPFFAILLCLTSANAAIDKIGKLDTLNAANEETRLSGDGYGTVGYQITGTWSGTITFEGTVTGATWVSITGYSRATGTGATTTTANGVFVVSSGGLRYVRARMSSYTSGNAFVQGLASMEQSVVDIASLPSVTVGTFPDNEPFNIAQVGGTTVLTGGVAGSQGIGGLAAHGAAILGSPVQQGVVAVTAEPTAEAANDAVYSIATVTGKQVIMPYALSGSRWNYAAASGGITNTTAVTVKAAAASGVKNCITSIQVINAHATVSTETLVLDGAAGTVLHRGWAQAGGGGYSVQLPVPVCGTAATLIEVDNVTTGAAVYYNLQGYTSAE